MLIGYARTSTLDQDAGLQAQERDLKGLGCNKVFSEQVSSVAPRSQLETALEYLRDGDVLVVTKLDRLARSVVHLGKIVETLKSKGAHLRIIAMGIDTSDATGTLMMNVLGSVAQFEREMMLERQREGIAKAKADGKYRGRKPTSHEKIEQVRMLKFNGKGATAIAREIGIGRATVYRILAT
jgi:DNA invertase Pin-like site-specific DNA recombinase